MPSDSPREIRVLIADDDVHNRTLLGEVCRGEGYQADLVGDGEEAVERALAGDYHVLLVDASMPKLSGYEVMERLRAEAKTSSLPIIMITAHPHDASRSLAEKLGVFAYIEKPFRIFDLTQRLRLAVRRPRGDHDPPTLPRVRARRALGDTLPKLPPPHQLRPYLKRALDEAMASKRALVCTVLRLETGARILEEQGRTVRDAALGAMLSYVREAERAQVHRSDENEMVWLDSDERASELPQLIASATRAISDTLEHEAPIVLVAGATVVPPGAVGADPDRVLRAARLLATRARKQGAAVLVEEYSPPEPEAPDGGGGDRTT